MNKFFSMFSGIGGFEKGIEDSKVNWQSVGYCEIDKYASAIYKYHYKEQKNYGDVRTVIPGDIPKFNILVGGFPCQSFSIAGKRQGFGDTRGTLFFEIARILSNKRPEYFLLENVKGILGHDGGQTLETIFRILSDLDYNTQLLVLNSKDFGVPQNRERVFFIGNLRGSSRPKIFYIEESKNNDGKIQRLTTNTITSRSQNAKTTGTYVIENKQFRSKIKKIGRINENGHNSIWGRVYDTKGITPTLNANGGGYGAKTGLYAFDKVKGKMANVIYDETGIAPTLCSVCEGGGYKSGYYAVGHTRDNKGKVTNYHKKETFQALNTTSGSSSNTSDFVLQDKLIRRLTEIECERLQGFPDNWTKFGLFGDEIKEISGTQRYKCIGNAVTTSVISYLVKIIDEAINGNR